MKKNRLCMPSRFNYEEIDNFYELNQKYKDLNVEIYEVYGSITPSPYGSGRHSLVLPSISIEELREYISYCHLKKIKFNYTLNGSCYSNVDHHTERNNLINFIRDLIDIEIDSITVAIPSLIYLLKRTFPDLVVHSSAVTLAKDIIQIKELETLGVSRVILDEDSNLMTSVLKNIKDLNIDVEVIAGSICLNQCVYKPFHHNFMVHSSKKDIEIIPANFYSTKCALSRAIDFRNILLSPWIRPEDLKIYSDFGIKYFKFPGRDIGKRDLYRLAECFILQKFSGNFLDLWSGFNNNVLSDIYYIENNSLDGFRLKQLNNEFLDIETLKEKNLQINKDKKNELVKHLSQRLKKFSVTDKC